MIVGGGLSGMTAALTARSQGARVAIVARTGLGVGTNTAMSNGVFSGPTTSYASQQYIDDTLRIGRHTGRPWMVEKVAADLPGMVAQIRDLGLEIAESKDHYYVVTGSGDPFPGVRLARVLAENLHSDQGIKRLTGTTVEQILTNGNRAVGLRGVKSDGRKITVKAAAVVLATGGAGALYLRNDNQKAALGQGYALAMEAGLDLWDMEFVQYYPVVIAQAHLPAVMLNPPHPAGSRLINSYGCDLAQEYGIDDLNDALRNRRDWLSAVLFKESLRGPVYMDYRAVAHHHSDRLPLRLLTNKRFDFRSRPVSISPAAHFVMGGVRVDHTAATDLPGLFACGEVVWGLHGACRKGGNALAECLVFGKLAGLHAAGALGAGRLPTGSLTETAENPSPSAAKDGGSWRELRLNLQTIAWQYAGVVRTAKGLNQGLARLGELWPRIHRLPTQPPQAGRTRMDLMSMAAILNIVLSASLGRQESRGCFIRNDFPDEDNERWLKNSRAQATADSSQPDLSYSPVKKR